MPYNDPESLMRETSQHVKPCLVFRMKMRYRLMKKHWEIYFCRPGAKTRFAAAITVVFVASTGSMGAYAYSSPDVNILHPLYPVKQTLESAELGMAGSPESRSKALLNRASHRMAEAERMQEMEGDGDMDDALGRTFEMMDADVQKSIMSAAVEHDIVVADRLSENMQNHLEIMHERLQKLAKNGVRCQQKEIKARVQNLEQLARNKIQRIQTARSQIREAMNRREKEIFLRDLMEETLPVPMMTRPE